MSLRHEIEEFARVKKPESILDRFIATLSDDERNEFYDVLADEAFYSAAQIARWIRSRGFQVSDNTVRTWRQQHGA